MTGLAKISAMAFFGLALTNSGFAKTYEGRLVGLNNQVFLRTEQASKTTDILVRKELTPYLGQQVWLEGSLDHGFLNVDNMVTGKDSLIIGKIGQGVSLTGSVQVNELGGLDFIPTEEHARALLNKKKSSACLSCGLRMEH